MLLTVLRAKIHRATVTETNLEYIGSITIDEEVLQAADILPGERVQVVNINNGHRFETYVLAGSPGSKTVGINGAAARLCARGDKVIVISYALMSYEEARCFKPRIVLLDDENRIRESRG